MVVLDYDRTRKALGYVVIAKPYIVTGGNNHINNMRKHKFTSLGKPE